MRPGIFYLSEQHEFSYIATVPWPSLAIGQQDWINSMTQLEQWLDHYIGQHAVEWAYSRQRDLEYWQASIAFRQERSKTLFLLMWS